MRKSVLVTTTTAAMMLTGLAAAQADSQQSGPTAASSNCLSELEQARREGEISEPARQDLRELEEAARVLAERGRNDACETMVQSIRDIRESERKNLQEKSNKRALNAAQPITEQERIVKVSAVNGSTVRNMEDQELGTIEDTVIDPQTGKVSYVVLSHGGLIGVGEKLIAVPWDALKVVEGEGDEEPFYVLSASKEYLEQRESLGEEDWPSEAATQWDAEDAGQ